MSNPTELHGVVAVVRREGRFLVIRRSQQVRAPGAFCFPGGGIEAGESERETLRREMREELGCEVKPVRPLWRSNTDWGVALAWWLCELPTAAALVPNPAEVHSVHWLTTAEMRANPQLLSSNADFLNALEAGQFTLDLPGDPERSVG